MTTNNGDGWNVGTGRTSHTKWGGGSERAVGVSRMSGVERTGKVRGDEGAPDLTGLWPYQREGVLWLRSRKNGLLGDDLGLGKTVTSLRALGKKARTIVICPASVAMSWEREIAKWRPDLKVTIGDSLRKPREREVLVLSYDGLPGVRAQSLRLVDEDLRDVTLILDECQMVKSDDALRTQRVRRLRVQCGTCWGLSATPMLGDPEDLWGVLVSLGLAGIYGDRRTFIDLCGGKERWIFDKRIGRKRRAGYEWGQVSPEVKEKLREVMLRRLADDVLEDLPESQVVDLPVEAPDDLREYLDQVKGEWDDVGTGDLPPFELLSEARAALARSRVGAAVEFVDQHASLEQPMLVFSAHIEPVTAMRGLKGVGAFVGGDSQEEKKRLVDAFMAGELRALAMTIKTGGAGLNLQRAASVLFVDREYTPGENKQAFGRARRQGNTRGRVLCYRFISDHPLDIRMQEILDEKERLISAAVG